MEQYGYSVIHVKSGEEAIDAVDGDPRPDAVLMDINLGSGILGTEAAQTILSRHDLPLLFLSSHIEKDIVEKTEGITSYGYVTKDSSITVLDASIKMAFKLFDSRKDVARREESYRLAMEATSEGVVDIDVAGLKAYASPTYFRILGVEPAAGETDPLDIERIEPEDRDSARGAEEALRSGTADCYDIRFRIRWPTGEIRCIRSVRRVATRDPDGAPARIVGTISDVTGERRLVASLRGTIQDLNAAQRLAHMGSWARRRDAPFSDWSDEVYDIIGIPKDGIAGSPREFLLSRVAPDDRAKLLEAMDRFDKEDFPVSVVVRVHRTDGAIRSLRIQADRPLDDSSEEGYIARGYLQDITEQVETEAKLREGERTYRSFFEQAAVGVAAVDAATGQIVQANRKLCEILGYSEAELLERTVPLITHPDDVQASRENMRRLLSGELPSFVMEKRYIRKDGSPIWVNLSVSPLRPPKEGGCAMNLAILEDIEGRKAYEREKDSRQRLFSAMFYESGAIRILIDPATAAILDANRRALDFLGCDLDALKAASLFDPVQIGVLNGAAGHEEGAGLGERRFPCRLRTTAGEIRDVEIAASPITLEGRRLLDAILVDLTDQRLSEAKNRALFEIFDDFDLGVALEKVVVDEKGDPIDFLFLDVNEAHERYTGLKPSQVINRRIRDIMPDVDMETVKWYCDAALSGVPTSRTYYSKSFGRWFQVRVVPVAQGVFSTVFRQVEEERERIEGAGPTLPSPE